MTKDDFKNIIEGEISNGENLLEQFSILMPCDRIYAIVQYDETAKQRLKNNLCIWEKRVLEILKVYFGEENQNIANEFSISDPDKWFDFKEFGIKCINDNLTTLKSILDRLPYIKINNQKEGENESRDVRKNKPFMVFISHSIKDKDFVECLVDLIEFIGIKNKENLFCSSIGGYGVPNSKGICKYLLELFNEYRLYVIIVHSDNYYSSPYSLNEMGAAWALGTDFCSLLVKGFDFDKMRGVIDNEYASIKVDADDAKSRLNGLKDELISIFQLEGVVQDRWETKRDNFLSQVNAL